jgi:putative ABC transport system permease protein
MQNLWQDIRFGLRMLAKSPGFTAIAVITLALGIGANTAIFSLMNQILLRRLPVKNPDELVILRAPGPVTGRVSSDGDSTESFSYPMYKGLRDTNKVFSGILARSTFAASVASRRAGSAAGGREALQSGR